MGHHTPIGRLAALAVVLGVGAAVVTCPGVAWADETDSGSESSETAPAATSDDDPNESDDDGTDESEDQTGDPQEPDAQESEESQDSAVPVPDDESATTEPDGDVVPDTTPTDLVPVDLVPTDLVPSGPSATEPQQPSPPRTGDTSHGGADADPTTPTDLSDLAADVARQAQPSEEGDGGAVIGVFTIDDNDGQASFVQHPVVPSFDLPKSDDSPNPLEPLLTLPAALLDVAIDFTVVMLRPLIEPGTGLDNAVLWGVLAWIRRETDRPLVYQSPSIPPHSVSLSVTPTA